LEDELRKVIDAMDRAGVAPTSRFTISVMPNARGCCYEELLSLGVRGMTAQADVTQPASVAAMHEAVVHTLGPRTSW
jgi:hypothetical protein